jgi:hypothetical protein
MNRSRPTARKPAAPTHALRGWLEALEAHEAKVWRAKLPAEPAGDRR